MQGIRSFIVILLLLLGLATLAFATGVQEAKEEFTWKLVVAANPGQPLYEQSVERIQERINNESSGRLKIELFSETEMGTGPEVMQNLRAGAVEMHWQAFALTTSYVPDYEFTSLPFIFADREHLNRFLATNAGKKFLRSSEKYGVYIFNTGLIGFRMPVASETLFRTPEDFEGFRMRTMENQIQIQTMRALDANPVVLPYAEVYQGIKTGVVDGYFNDRNSFEYLSIYEVAPYFTELPLFSLGLSLAISKTSFDALPTDLQDLVRTVVEEEVPRILDVQWNYNMQEKEWKTALFKEYHKVEDLTPFIEAVQPMYKKFIEEHPESEEFIETALKTQ
jgi:TRAP-type C4-dicarboxylate transport system substrate-binding protein